MVAIDLDEPTTLRKPYDYLAIIKVWSESEENSQKINIYYNKDESPKKLKEEINWLINKSINYVDFEATDAKVTESFTYIKSGYGGQEYYA